jgi:DNA-binding winged helix-turn-helix (wHTH) protein
MRVRFGEYVFDAEVRELRRGGERIDLTPKAFELLALLIARRPRPLRHAELKDALWPDSSVGYTSLARLVAVVRKALGDTAGDPAFVRTVPRYGYAFAGNAVDDAAPALATLVLVADDRELRLSEGETLLGRGPECGVRLAATGVSRIHAGIRIRDGRAVIQDRDSKNGTWVNGKRIAEPVALEEGDELFVGSFRLVVRRIAATSSTRTAPPPRTTKRPLT